MAGKDRTGEVAAFLSRLLDDNVLPDTKVRLRSVQRAAFQSWARKEMLPVRYELLTGSTPVSARDLLGGAAFSALPATARRGDLSIGIGIDIEDVAALPQADDYRDHAFFQDNFAPAEISYCLLQADVRASLCGTWAAKEALIKAGVDVDPASRLRGIEIDRDASGRPTYPGWHISISHTSGTAVAVCVAQPSPLAPPRTEAAHVPAEELVQAAAVRSRSTRKINLSLGIATAVAVMTSVALLLQLLPRG